MDVSNILAYRDALRDATDGAIPDIRISDPAVMRAALVGLFLAVVDEVPHEEGKTVGGLDDVVPRMAKEALEIAQAVWRKEPDVSPEEVLRREIGSRMGLQPWQPVVEVDGILRFRRNQAVVDLFEHGPFGMEIAADADLEDRVQFLQLLGFDVDGFARQGLPRIVVELAEDRIAEREDGDPVPDQEIVWSYGEPSYRRNAIVARMFTDPSRVATLRDPGRYDLADQRQLLQLIGTPRLALDDEATVRRWMHTLSRM